MSDELDKAVALAEWTVIAPDGTRFTGPSPLKAALPASKYQLEIDPEAQRKFLQAIETIRQEGAAERDECLSKYGTLDCPACHGSGHIADTEPFRNEVRQQVIEELANKPGVMPKVKPVEFDNGAFFFCDPTEVREAIATMEAMVEEVERDRDEWKDATISANRRFEIAERELEKTPTEQEMAEIAMQLMTLRGTERLVWGDMAAVLQGRMLTPIDAAMKGQQP